MKPIIFNFKGTVYTGKYLGDNKTHLFYLIKKGNKVNVMDAETHSNIVSIGNINDIYNHIISIRMYGRLGVLVNGKSLS